MFQVKHPESDKTMIQQFWFTFAEIDLSASFNQ